MASHFQRRGSVLGCAIAFAITAGYAQAKQAPTNLGYGLDVLISAQQSRGPNAVQLDEGYTTTAAQDYLANAIIDAPTGRVLVDIVLSGRQSLDKTNNALTSIASFGLLASDASYRRTGIIEAYVALEDVPALARTAGVRAVFLAQPPELNVALTPREPAPAAQEAPGAQPQVTPGQILNKIGTAFDQGVVQHGVDRINQLYNPNAPVNYDGSGITVAAISDSYDKATAAPHAADGVASFDLPGAATNPINTQPVVVLVDSPAAATDEGRGMVEILHKMAPRARLGFAAANGEVLMAESIRRLANLPDHPGVAGFTADVITDDVSFGGEPFYAESIIGAAIDDVAAAGVSYFSSAGNNIGIDAYEAPLRIVANGIGNTAATNTALVGTNIDLTGVPPELYAGGFHNFNPATGQLDVAQLVNYPVSTSVANSQRTELQWDDPYDLRDLVASGPAIYTGTGTIGGAVTSVTFDQNSTPPLPQLTQGQPYIIQETATSGDLDGIVQIFDSNGVKLIEQDTDADETVDFYPPTTGNYRIVVMPFQTTTGNFTLTVTPATGTAGVTTDLNLLAFRADTGAYISSQSLTANNLANNRPVEIGRIGSPTGQTQMQFVISRSNTPTATTLPTLVHWTVRGNGAGGFGPAEYFSYNTTTMKGHATAKGCNGTAAYGVFRPNLPESYTSPGPATIFFDHDSNRLPVPDYRQQPTVAAADNANTSFFTGDVNTDLDTNPNFPGTSAAAPHAAAIAVLVLQAHGGPGSVTPAEMTQILQRSAFPHDLDPSSALGVAPTSGGGTVTLTIDSDNDSNALTGLNDPNSIALTYDGPGSIESITFNPEGTAATGGNVTGGNNGIQNNAGSNPATVTYFENDFPGLVFEPATKAFTLGNLTGLTPADVIAPLGAAPFTGFSNLAGTPSNGTSHFWTMTVGFASGQFTAGKVLHFTVGRGAQHSAVTGNGATIGAGSTTSNPIADLFGGGVFLPRGSVVRDGMTFSGTTSGGGTFHGVIRNGIGAGYTTVDGYGFIDAASAVDLIFRNGFD